MDPADRTCAAAGYGAKGTAISLGACVSMRAPAQDCAFLCAGVAQGFLFFSSRCTYPCTVAPDSEALACAVC